jgi:hypothetical protein
MHRQQVMSRYVDKYTSEVTKQYKQATKNRLVRYTIEENLQANPDVLREFKTWEANLKKPKLLATFAGVFHEDYSFPLFDIRTAEIREDWGQRNALDKGRKNKILGIAKNFDVMLFQPIDVDFILDEGVFIIRDGGGRATGSYMNGIYFVPASVRVVSNYAESRRLFNAQDQYAAAISSHDKFLQQLLDKTHSRHKMACDTWSIAASSGFSLHHSDRSASTPLVEGISTLQRVIRTVGGDASDVKWGARRAPNVATAIDVIKSTFDGIDEVPVSVLEAIAAFIYVSKNRLPTGVAGLERLKEFFAIVRKSSEGLKDLSNWTTELHFDSANNYATYGAASLMQMWNTVFKNKNKGRTSSYKYVKWTDTEIEIIKSNLMVFARDESLYPQM